MRESVKGLEAPRIGTPENVIAGMVLLCLAAFWVTIPMPRVDGQLVGSDGLHYYVYLPSVLLDGDLDFTDDYQRLLAYDQQRLEQHLARRNAHGVPINDWGFGPALLWAPFFVLAHGLVSLVHALGGSVSTEGYSYWYQAFVLSGSIVYGGAGVFLAYRAVVRYASERAALVAAVLITLGGNLVYYMTAEPFMAHAPSAFLSGLFFYVWLARRGDKGVRRAMLLGALGGLMALVRPQDGLFLVLPFLDRLAGVWRAGSTERRVRALAVLLRDGVVAAAVALLVFSPQWMAWDFFYGDAEAHTVHVPEDGRAAGASRDAEYAGTTPYTRGKARFNWRSPKLGRVVFSAHRGLFVWHPIFLIALLGLMAHRKHRWLGVLGLVGFVMQWYIVSSWFGWMQGEAFGGRMFIVCTPMFMLGLAWLVDRATQLSGWKVVYLIGMLLLVWNFLLFIEYRFDLVQAARAPTWEDVTTGRITFLLERLFE